MFLSIIIPAYNEEHRLGTTLFKLHDYLKNQSYDYQIMVVDDGSTDNTVGLVTDAKKSIANLELLQNAKNHGKGFVVRQGLLAVKGDWRLFLDADNSTSIDQLPNFLPMMKNYDVIIASRSVKGAVVNPGQPFVRRLLGKISKLAIYLVVGVWGIEDTQCGFKLFSKKAVEAIAPRCTVNGWVFDAEMLKVAQIKGFNIKEVPVVWKNDLRSTVKISDAKKTFLDLLRIRLNLLLGKYTAT